MALGRFWNFIDGESWGFEGGVYNETTDCKWICTHQICVWVWVCSHEVCIWERDRLCLRERERIEVKAMILDNYRVEANITKMFN